MKILAFGLLLFSMFACVSCRTVQGDFSYKCSGKVISHVSLLIKTWGNDGGTPLSGPAFDSNHCSVMLVENNRGVKGWEMTLGLINEWRLEYESLTEKVLNQLLSELQETKGVLDVRVIQTII